MSKIFVGRLAWKTSRDVLANYFSKFGQVTDARIISDRTTGRSKGFGFVTFADQAAADQAMKTTTHEIDGRAIIVNMANQHPSGPPPSFDFQEGGGDQSGGAPGGPGGPGGFRGGGGGGGGFGRFQNNNNQDFNNNSYNPRQ